MSKQADKPQATLPFYNRIALVFDFDETLAEDTFSALLRHLEQEPEAFKKKYIAPLTDDGWEKQLARMHALVELNRTTPVTRDALRQVGQTIELFAGVREMFGRVRARARATVDDVEVEFYLVTGGFLEIMRATPIASEFTALYGCELYYRDGAVSFAKTLLPDAQKARYLAQISQGLVESRGNPGDVARDVNIDQLHVPYHQMIYVGDGASDMEAFGLMSQNGGIALGIYKDDGQGWAQRDAMRADRRLQNLVPADYRQDSELMQSLLLATDAISAQIALKKLGQRQ